MAENKGLLTEIIQIIRDETVWNATATTRDLVSCKSAAQAVLAKIREVVEGAGLTDEKLWEAGTELISIPDGVDSLSHYELTGVDRDRAIAQAQRQAILKALRED